MEIRDAIKTEMIKKRLTPLQLAEHLKLTAAAVYSWLNGTAKPSYITAYKLADFFGVDPKMFLE